MQKGNPEQARINTKWRILITHQNKTNTHRQTNMQKQQLQKTWNIVNKKVTTLIYKHTMCIIGQTI